jgi:lipopolysaccharide export system protein LptC
MATSIAWQQASLRPKSRARRQPFAEARRHTRLVRVLRVLFPLGGAAVIAGFVVATRFALPDGIDLSAASLSVTRNAVIMENPRLTGFDGEGREYSVSADRAIQALARPGEVRLEAIEARIVAGERGGAIITAEAGDYDHGRSTLRLIGDIRIASADGYRLRMTGADIDFRSRTLVSEHGVSVRYQNSEIAGERASVTDGGRRILVEKVRTLLMPPKRGRTPAPAE